MKTITDAGVPVDADYYLCGPGAFMRELSAALIARGTPPEHVAMEVFGAAAVTFAPGLAGERPAPHPPTGEPGTGPPVTFSRSNLVVAMGSELRQPARARRGLRHPGQLRMPHRRLPLLRDRAARRRGRLHHRATGAARQRARARVLRAARRGDHAGTLSHAPGMRRGDNATARQRDSATARQRDGATGKACGRRLRDDGDVETADVIVVGLGAMGAPRAERWPHAASR